MPSARSSSTNTVSTNTAASADLYDLVVLDDTPPPARSEPSAPTRLTCAGCGFDAARWSADDVERTLAHADDLIGYALADAPTDLRDEFREPFASDPDPIVATHRLMHGLCELAQRRASTETFSPMTGSVDSIQVATGLPKTSVPEAVIDVAGVDGDRQTNRRNHGRPWQAVCLYSADLIHELRAEGHTIVAGSAGENVTMRGIDWTRMRGGLTIEIGDVRMLTSSPAAPCHKIGDNFIERDWLRIGHDDRPGWSRWYASVLAGGTIRPGDQVTVRA